MPRSSTKNIDVKASIATIFRGQKCFDNWLNGEPKHARIEDGFVLDDDNVGIVEGARWYGRHQRQGVFSYIAQGELAELSPGKRVEKGGYEGRKKTPPQRCDLLERNGPAACPVCCCQTNKCDAEQKNLEFQRNWRPGHVEQSRDCGQNECDASRENSYYCERVLYEKKWNGPCKRQRKIRHGQFQPAMIMLDL